MRFRRCIQEPPKPALDPLGLFVGQRFFVIAHAGKDSMPTVPYPLTDAHYLAFGKIVQLFARFERFVEICLTTAIRSEYVATVVAISGLGYAAKCDALRSVLLLPGAPLSADQSIITAMVNDFNAFSALRNSIAHHTWRSGNKAGTIKPMSASSRGGKPRLRGTRSEEDEYTIDELLEVVAALEFIYAAFTGFLVSRGLLDASP